MNVKTSSEKMREHLRSALGNAIAHEGKTNRRSYEEIDKNIIKATKLSRHDKHHGHIKGEM